MVYPRTWNSRDDRFNRALRRLHEHRPRRRVSVQVNLLPTRIITRPASPDAYAPINHWPFNISYSPPTTPPTSTILNPIIESIEDVELASPPPFDQVINSPPELIPIAEPEVINLDPPVEYSPPDPLPPLPQYQEHIQPPEFNQVPYQHPYGPPPPYQRNVSDIPEDINGGTSEVTCEELLNFVPTGSLDEAAVLIDFLNQLDNPIPQIQNMVEGMIPSFN